MKLAVITDSSAYLEAKILQRENLFILDIPVNIDGEEYVEGVNLTADQFYHKMAKAAELPKTSQPSIAKLDEILATLKEVGYTHVLGLFLSSGISGFYQNIQYMIDEYEVDGVLEIILQACHTFAIEAHNVKKAVIEKGKSYINIETDYSMADIGQITTRLEAFLETIDK